MKGDFTRSTFDPSKDYTQVRKQQGRVDLDADWNEYVDIQAHLSETVHTDVIGQSGVPKEGGGFKIGLNADGTDLTISSGRIYVDGILAEISRLDHPTYQNQPYLPNPGAILPAKGRTDLVYLDIWDRHITALEDPHIREVALNGPDTATRVQTVWQVKIGKDVEKFDCKKELPPNWPPVPPLHKRGRLTAAVDPDEVSADPCDIPAEGGYRGLENRLYRVEIHNSGDLGTATFKWSRDNGSVVFSIESFVAGEPEKVVVSQLGRDQVLGLRIGDWVEILGDETELKERPGTLVEIIDLDEAKRELTLSADVTVHSGEAHPKVRRWDMENAAITTAAGPLSLEAGIQVNFDGGGRYYSGDYWLIPARTNLGDIEAFEKAPPMGIEHHYALLALVTWEGENEGGAEPVPEVIVLGESGRKDLEALRAQADDLKKDLERAQTDEDRARVERKLEEVTQQIVQITGEDKGGDAKKKKAEKVVVSAGERDGEIAELRAKIREIKAALEKGSDNPDEETALLEMLKELETRLEELLERGEGDAGPGFSASISDCRHPFPPLTAIWADDVFFDNDHCQLNGAETVQDAIDQLCMGRDLRHHNKHLHGWGIVCGLQVKCGPDIGELRRLVTVKDGYALDCEGNDLILPTDTPVDILEGIAELLRENPDEPVLDDRGNGEVNLIIEMDERGLPVISVERFALPGDGGVLDSLLARLDGTLLMDFFNDCIKDLYEDILELLRPQEGDTALVTPVQKRLISLGALAVQTTDRENGRFVYISAKMHAILEELYNFLKERLKSETFCAMFDKARPFPDFPFPEHKMHAIFGNGYATRMRMHPGGRYAYTTGTENKIYVFDLNAEEMVAELETPGGEGIVVHDVAFNAEGNQLYAAATLGSDTFFAIADINNGDHDWQPLNVMHNVQLVTLGTSGLFPGTVFAIGKGSGLYLLNLDALSPDPQPFYGFNGVGQTRFLEEGSQSLYIYATAASDEVGSSDHYDRVIEFNLDAGSQEISQPRTFMLISPETGQTMTGQEDLEIIYGGFRKPNRVFAVVDPSYLGGPKGVLGFDTGDETSYGLVPVENAGIRLGHVPNSSYLITAFANSHRIGLIDTSEFSVVDAYRLPTFIFPNAVAVSPDGSQVYIHNYGSASLLKVDAQYLNPDKGQIIDPHPGSDEFMRALVDYRAQMLEAFYDLAGGFLQYLKDCFCDHLLVNCPECDDEPVKLGAVSIRGGEVYKVCNFTGRQYVKTFPTVSYWLSLIPLAPLVDWGVEYLCCLILPDLFGGLKGRDSKSQQAGAFMDTEEFGEKKAGRTADTQMKMAFNPTRLSSLNLREMFTDRFDVFKTAGSITVDSLMRQVATTGKGPQAEMKGKQVVGVNTATAKAKMEAANIKVAEVKEYDASSGLQNIRKLASAPMNVKTGQEVVLHQKDGIVKFYEVVDRSAAASMETKAVMPGDHVTIEKLQENLTAKDAEIQTLTGRLQTIESKQTTLESNVTVEKITTMESELAELRAFKAQVEAFMEKNGGDDISRP